MISCVDSLDAETPENVEIMTVIANPRVFVLLLFLSLRSTFIQTLISDMDTLWKVLAICAGVVIGTVIVVLWIWYRTKYRKKRSGMPKIVVSNEQFFEKTGNFIVEQHGETLHFSELGISLCLHSSNRHDYSDSVGFFRKVDQW